jgi:hypothetical protein
MQWDELRIGRSWADVTTPTPPVITEITKLPNGAVRIRYRSESAQSHSVHTSNDLLTWSPLGSAAVISPGIYEFTDPAAATLSQRFYQLRSPDLSCRRGMSAGFRVLPAPMSFLRRPAARK